jgi:molybdopterin converting factor small subunit
MSKRIDVSHFGPMREARGCSDEAVSTEAATPRELYAELGLEASFPLSGLRVAVNDVIASWDAPLGDGDRVVFLSPSSGG